MPNEEIIGGGSGGNVAQSQEQIAAAAAATGGTGAGGEFKWQSHLTETFKDQPDVLKDFTTKGYTDDPAGVQKLAKDFTEAQKVIGQKGITKLPENATDEQKKAFNESLREVLGVPKDKAGYGELPPEVNGVKADPKTRDWFLDQAIKLGLTPQQVKDLDAASFDLMKEINKSDEALNAEFDTAAKTRWGQNADAKMKEAQALIAANVSPQFKDLVGKMDNNALLLMSDILLSQQAKNGSEDLPGGNGGGAASKSADDLQAEKLQLMGSKAYKDPFDPQHKETAKRVLDLNEQVVKIREATKNK